MVWGSSYAGGHVVAVAVADGRVAAAISQMPAMDGAVALLNLARYAGPGHLARLRARRNTRCRRLAARSPARDGSRW